LFPAYGQNLVALARGLAAQSPEALRVLDIGANVGDSALQILSVADARVLCVEADPYWRRYLELNTGGNADVQIVSALLVAADDDKQYQSVRRGGTTQFMQADERKSAEHMTVRDLFARYPDFAAARLIKSDTDGFDTSVVPALAAAIEGTAVFFFEYDPRLTRSVAGRDAATVWSDLDDCGYTRAAVWDNLGTPLGQGTIADVEKIARNDDAWRAPKYYWDVAVWADDDREATSVLSELNGADFSAVASSR
jgi:FkbM family methyltransferase